ncbi:hypothetical protein AMS58_10615 [Pseudoalteromonas porphyrae]|nr:hypothetical protein AMS58_10615 [Pseudoalteromonas porphyrae]
MIICHRSKVHCSTGSLESNVLIVGASGSVHCRTGSLENIRIDPAAMSHVHCHTGSLGDDGPKRFTE